MTFEALEGLGTVALVSCEHCGQPRTKLRMRQLRAELGRVPSPLLLRMVGQLRKIYGGDATIYVCSACSCVTGDLAKHSH
jgi:hypothetical protein